MILELVMMDVREFSFEIWSIELAGRVSCDLLLTSTHRRTVFEGGVSIWLCPTPPTKKKPGDVFIDAESLKIISCLIKIDTLTS